MPFRGKLAVLARDADIFVQGYWPGAIAALGRDPEKVAKIRPGIIYVSRPSAPASRSRCRGRRSTTQPVIWWRAERGGSWHVCVSLAQTAHWLRRLGRIDGMACTDPKFDDVRDRLEEMASGFGRLTAVRHAAVMDETPPHWARPSVPLGTHPAAWPN